MNSLETTAVIFCCAFGAGILGMVLHVKLPDDHLDTSSKDVVKLVMGLIATMAALVLSLLIASGSSSYQTQDNEVRSIAANVLLLDRVLSFYGPEAKDTRGLLKQGIVDVHDRIWAPNHVSAADLDPQATKGMADTFMQSLERLSPKTDSQITLKSQAMQIAQNLGQTRLLMFEQSGSSISWPFLTILVFWICMLFLGFGLFAQFNATVTFALFIGSISVGGAIFLILELSAPYAGFMRISDAPARCPGHSQQIAGTRLSVDYQQASQASKKVSARLKRLQQRVSHAVMVGTLLATLCIAPVRADEPPHFVGAAACSGCHQSELALWQTSHHAKAMQPATSQTVLGIFDSRARSPDGTTFSHSGEAYSVRTDGADGQLHDYTIAYTFGVDPLQQYLVGFPEGRFQALGIAWDSREQEKGGQRWFTLYPDHKLTPTDTLHWTGRDQTWNYMCAACHSTNLQKNYDPVSASYKTTWTDVDVSCEACHGPGSAHIDWAHAGKAPAASADRLGLAVSLKPADHDGWIMNAETGIARRTKTVASTELDACAGCHARRTPITKTPQAGAPLLDAYLPALLEPGLYHPDGQIDGEVFEYGSFVQSRMYRAGVTCSNCHEPHGATLRAEGNSLCAQCHVPAKFDVPEHSHHQQDSAGAQCVNCHMPSKTYMVIDDRRDHSIRVPRPDLSASLGTPNACTQCHRDRPSEWAARAVAQWYPTGRQTTPGFGTALYAGRTGAVGAEQRLDSLILDHDQPGIARATALSLLPPYASIASEAAIAAAIADPDPLVRAAAPRALSAGAQRETIQAELSLLRDPMRAVRIEAARAFASIPTQALSMDQQAAYSSAYDELVAAETTNEDRPEAHLNLGLLHTRRGQPADADAEYRAALRLDPAFVPALLNLADLDRMRGIDAQGEALLRQALSIEPRNADVSHALGLLLVRQHNYAAALPYLRQAAEWAPDKVRYAYVYAIALNGTGNAEQSRALLQQAHRQHPGDRDVLMALLTAARKAGDRNSFMALSQELAEMNPNPQAGRLPSNPQNQPNR